MSIVTEFVIVVGIIFGFITLVSILGYVKRINDTLFSIELFYLAEVSDGNGDKLLDILRKSRYLGYLMAKAQEEKKNDTKS